MARLLNISFWVLIALYAAALFIWAVGTLGWFGQERDPLSALFLVPLGLPWTIFSTGAPDAVLPWIGGLAPIVNIALLRWLMLRYLP
ncbi:MULTISPECIES: hypothetical protein [Falsihalocynthiibacter]|uniref:hypothetical protein n=1 Tax=Falsihalocynthiibacter TaxID=2854182 RepID=UPI0030019BB1